MPEIFIHKYFNNKLLNITFMQPRIYLPLYEAQALAPFGRIVVLFPAGDHFSHLLIEPFNAALAL